MPRSLMFRVCVNEEKMKISTNSIRYLHLSIFAVVCLKCLYLVHCTNGTVVQGTGSYFYQSKLNRIRNRKYFIRFDLIGSVNWLTFFFFGVKTKLETCNNF